MALRLNLRGLYETPGLRAMDELARGPRRCDRRRAGGRSDIAHRVESKTAAGSLRYSRGGDRGRGQRGEAVAAAAIGYPVVLKLHSETITHKTDVGGVAAQSSTRTRSARLTTHSESVRQKAGADIFCGVTVQPMVTADGYELILGSSIDPQFGPVLLFGAVDKLVEVYKDRALACRH